MEKILVIYHRVDFDGLFSAASVEYLTTEEAEFYFYGFNYGDEIPVIDDFLKDYSKIYMTDISFGDPDVMMKLRNSGKVIWIDHHITAIKASEEGGWSDMKGLRRNGTAATKLVWEYFGDPNVPNIILYVSAYDVWDHTRFDWDNTILPAQYGLRLNYGLDLDLVRKDLDNMICDSEFCENIIKQGLAICNYNKSRWQRDVENHSFPVTIESRPDLKALGIINTEFTSSVFWNVQNEYDVFVFANWSADTGVFGMSLRSGCPNFNCGEFMKKYYSGGGHPGAAGGKMTEDQFIKFIKERKI